MCERAVKKQREWRKAKSCVDLGGFYVDRGLLLCAQLFCVLFFGDNIMEDKDYEDFKKKPKNTKTRIFNKGAYYG